MVPSDIFDKCLEIRAERRKEYGESCLEVAAIIASGMLNKSISSTEVTTILLALKFARYFNQIKIKGDPTDTIIDIINYLIILEEERIKKYE